MLGTQINHNVLSLTAQRNLFRSHNELSRAMIRLSSGLRINSADEDPAALAISERFRAQIASMEEAERNAEYAMNLISTAEGALSIADEILTRMRALSIEASNGALTDGDREALNLEFQHLKDEITRIANTTNYNGLHLLNGDFSGSGADGIKFHIGTYNTEDEDFYYLSIQEMTASALGLSAGSSIATTALAQAAIGEVDSAITSKDNARTTLGAYVERLQHTIRGLQISRENTIKSESTIRDADIAREMSEFTRAQILTKSGIAMLAQANLVPQIIAGLLG